jgi:hypothetical protein
MRQSMQAGEAGMAVSQGSTAICACHEMSGGAREPSEGPPEAMDAACDDAEVRRTANGALFAVRLRHSGGRFAAG